MAFIRTAIQDFATANNLYVNAIVTFYKVLDGEKSSEKATLYSSITGEGKLANPQTLDSFGKFKSPVYIDEAVIMSVTGLDNVEDHDTGVVSISPGFEFLGGMIEEPENKEYKLIINAPFAAEILSVTTECASGSCTLTTKINGVALGGDENAATTTQEEQEHETANEIAVGDTLSVTVTDNLNCQDLSITIKFLRK